MSAPDAVKLAATIAWCEEKLRSYDPARIATVKDRRTLPLYTIVKLGKCAYCGGPGLFSRYLAVCDECGVIANLLGGIDAAIAAMEAAKGGSE